MNASPRLGRHPATPTSGLRLRVLIACSRSSGGYAPEQLIERFGHPGMDAARYLVRGGYLAHDEVNDRYLRTAAGDAVCPTRRALREAPMAAPTRAPREQGAASRVAARWEAAPAEGLPCAGPGSEAEIEAWARQASADRPLSVADLAEKLGRHPSNMLRTCGRLADEGRIALRKVCPPGWVREVWVIWAVGQRQAA